MSLHQFFENELKPIELTDSDRAIVCYRKRDVRELSSYIFELDESAFLAVITDPEEFKVSWAVMAFDHGYCMDEPEDYFHTIQISGYGFSGNLRECRHTYWGDGGYIFSPNVLVISQALLILAKWFDMR